MSGLSMEGITKYYPASDTLANDGASIRVPRGEIHALVGENGAGKTTLMRILYGLERPDAGRIVLDGEVVRIGNPAEAARQGIGMVHQHFMIVDDFTVSENVVLGAEPKRAGFLFDPKAASRVVQATMDRHGFRLDPERRASELTVGERQQLEIVRLLYREAKILILDEPTAVLTEQEIRALFDTLRALRASGHTIVIITHKVKEVKEISDTVTVMRGGRTVERLNTADVDEYGLSCLIMGTSRCPDFARGSPPSLGREPVLAMKDVSLGSRNRERLLLDRVSLGIRPGEILGVCSVTGNGSGELEDLLGGFRKPTSGQITLAGLPLPARRLPARSGRGIGYVPADRMRRGSCTGISVSGNFMALDRRHFFTRGLLDDKKMLAETRGAIARFSIKAEPSRPAGELSGGNIQKVILARELTQPPPSFILFSDPTWGLDIASTEFIYERIVEARNAGSAILLISSNLDEILALSDRVSVMYRGRIVCDLPNDGHLGRELLGRYMLGLAEDTATEDTPPEDAAAENTAVGQGRAADRAGQRGGARHG